MKENPWKHVYKNIGIQLNNCFESQTSTIYLHINSPQDIDHDRFIAISHSVSSLDDEINEALNSFCFDLITYYHIGDM